MDPIIKKVDQCTQTDHVQINIEVHLDQLEEEKEEIKINNSLRSNHF
jgi:hypothetical protein